ncbi:MAG: GDP-mannose 4,6-dehydratase [Archangium sp.]
MKHLVVIGSAGQDGSYLSEQAAANGWRVSGFDLGNPAPLSDRAAMSALVTQLQPDALVYLAAAHHSSEDPARALGDELVAAEQVHVIGWLHTLDALRAVSPKARAFYAASSHCFGEGNGARITERTPLAPKTPYALTKAHGVELGRLFRAQGQHVSSGFLFNHESPRRAPRFVSQRICRGAVAAARARSKNEPFTLELGSTSAVVDWGYAPDYTRAMLQILEADTPDDYVIASGVPHSVADWCRLAFGAVGLEWREFVVERAERMTRTVAPLIGDSTLLEQRTGWRPATTFEAMVEQMVRAAEASP